MLLEIWNISCFYQAKDSTHVLMSAVTFSQGSDLTPTLCFHAGVLLVIFVPRWNHAQCETCVAAKVASHYFVNL